MNNGKDNHHHMAGNQASRDDEIVSLKKITEISKKFFQMPLGEIDYRVITDELLALSGAKFVAFNSYEENVTKTVTRAISGIAENIEKASEILGFEITGKAWDVIPKRMETIRGGSLKRFDNLYDAGSGAVSKHVVYLLEKMFRIGEVYVGEVVYEENQLGDFIFFMPKGKSIENPDIIELLINQAGMLILRKRSEEALKKSEEKYRELVENLNEVIYTLDENANITYVSPSVEAVSGYSPAELAKKRFTEIVHPDDIEGRIEQYFKIMSGVKEASEYRFVTKDGRVIWVRTSARPVFKDGLVVGVQGVLNDITDRKKAEEKLEKEKEKFKILFESSTASIIVYDKDSGEIIDANQKAIKSYGFSYIDELRNNDFWLDPFKEALDWIHKAAKEGPQNHEWLSRKKTGEYFWEDIWLNKIVIDDVERIMVVSNDITDHKKMEMELKKSWQEAEAASIAKSRFLANMSHEIRTPFSGVLGTIELLSKTELSEEQREYINLLKLSVDSLVNIINDILDISKIEAGNMELTYEDFDIYRLVDSVVRLFDPLARQKGLFLSSRISPEVPRYVNGDPERIRQILNNLLNNATKFTEHGTIELTVDLSAMKGKHATLVFAVKDTGIGIPEEKLDGIYEPFMQVDDTIQRKYGGTGLGLAICRNLVELMGGRIWIESKPDRGTEVFFTVKLEKAKSNEKQKTAEVPEKQKTGDMKMRVLLAEDDEVNLIMTRKTLEAVGHTCRIATNGEEAVKLFSRERFDLIIMDIQMPGMDGFTATAKIRELEKTQGMHVPIIALTAHAMPGDREQCLKAGMDYYVTKPLYYEKLISLIGELFGGDNDKKQSSNDISVDALLNNNEEIKDPPKDIFEHNSLYERVNRDPVFFNRMIESLEETSERLMHDIYSAICENNGEKMQFAAHALKGSLSAFNDETGKEFARKLEEKGGSSDFSETESLTRELKEHINNLLKSLRNFIS